MTYTTKQFFEGLEDRVKIAGRYDKATVQDELRKMTETCLEPAMKPGGPLYGWRCEIRQGGPHSKDLRLDVWMERWHPMYLGTYGLRGMCFWGDNPYCQTAFPIAKVVTHRRPAPSLEIIPCACVDPDEPLADVVFRLGCEPVLAKLREAADAVRDLDRIMTEHGLDDETQRKLGQDLAMVVQFGDYDPTDPEKSVFDPDVRAKHIRKFEIAVNPTA